MIGVINIGNTNNQCAIFDKLTLKKEEKIDNPFRIKDFFKEVNEIMMISVVPNREKLIRGIIEIPIIDFPNYLFEMDYESHAGCDRLSNGLAAKELTGLPAIVVDCGSAITVDLFSEPRKSNTELIIRFDGGAILPGLFWYFSTLDKGEALPEITPELQNTIGKSTSECIKFGAYGALVGGIKEVLNKLDYENKNLIFTGGDGEIFRQFFEDGYYEPFLTIKGGVIAYHKKHF
ncbi:MAG: type III pantothenate kinase [Candidatus Stahlbacteria bacterium]|nr:MAG: type III pantothenate kinase [Candidatus Stahlbacteria bacterium]